MKPKTVHTTRFTQCRSSSRSFFISLAVAFSSLAIVGAQPLVAQLIPVESKLSRERKPIPDKLVVLTFDDSAKSHYTVVRPLLLRYGFGATFFITEGFDFASNKRDYMTWDEIAQLHRDGFEIGNHTRDHLAINDANVPRLVEQLEGVAKRCQE